MTLFKYARAPKGSEERMPAFKLFSLNGLLWCEP